MASIVTAAAWTVLLAACGQPPPPSAPVTNTITAKESISSIFSVTLPDLGGQPQALQQWRGKVLVVNYWATWCPPCREEMPGFDRLHQKLGPQGVQFVGISIDTADKVVEFQKSTPVSYPLLIGDMSAMGSSVALGNTRQALPFTAVIDREGRTAAIKLGKFSETDLELLLNTLIGPGTPR